MEYRLLENVLGAIKSGHPASEILLLAEQHHGVCLQPSSRPTPSQDCNSNTLTLGSLQAITGHNQAMMEAVDTSSLDESESSGDHLSELTGDTDGNVFGIPCCFLLLHSLMLAAIEESHVELARAVLERNYDLHSPFIKRMRSSPIHVACYYGNKDMIELLASQKVDIQTLAMAPDRSIKPALALAIRHDNVELLEILLPLYGDKCSTYIRTPLHLACEEGAYHVARHLLDTKDNIDVNATDFSGHTALMLAVRQDLRLVKLLLQHQASVEFKTPDKGRQCLHMLFCESVGGPKMFLPLDAHEIAQEIVSHGADVNRFDIHLETPLSLLCGQLATELHQFTYNRFPYPLEQHHTILRDCIHFLLEQGAALNMENGVLPFNVVMNGVRAALEAMIGRSWANVNDAKNFESTMEFALELVDLLGSHGANPDSFNVYLLSPLTQMFVQLHSCQYIKDAVWERVWPTVYNIFLLLLRLGARECELREAFWRQPYKTDVISMVLNALPQATHQSQLWGVCRHMRRQATSQALQQHLQWCREKASNPRTLRQLARVCIYKELRYQLKTAVHELPVPSLIQEYILSFED